MEHNTIQIRQSTLDAIDLLDHVIQSPTALSELFTTDRSLFSPQQQHTIDATVGHQSGLSLEEVERHITHALALINSLRRDIAETELGPMGSRGQATSAAFTELEKVTNDLTAQIEKCTLDNQEDGMARPCYTINEINSGLLQTEQAKQILHDYQTQLSLGNSKKFDKTYWQKTLEELRECTNTIGTISEAYYVQ
ncbi:hypothetical protein CLU79DRAFT_833709 [Phycomyces nitens]|nr:hypothetical protein CLU79DRAFT_833709 [Phycomyces nitens]